MNFTILLCCLIVAISGVLANWSFTDGTLSINDRAGPLTSERLFFWFPSDWSWMFTSEE